MTSMLLHAWQKCLFRFLLKCVCTAVVLCKFWFKVLCPSQQFTSNCNIFLLQCGDIKSTHFLESFSCFRLSHHCNFIHQCVLVVLLIGKRKSPLLVEHFHQCRYDWTFHLCHSIFYFHCSGMSEVLQGSSLLFEYMAIISFTFFLVLEGAGFHFCLVFLKHIYSQVKCD